MGKHLVLLGPPGAGKGTQGKLLAQRLGVPFIGMGDLLRQKVEENSSLAQELREIMAKGSYVPDETVIRILEERIESPDAREGFILDGFPRTVAQADALDQLLERQGKTLDGMIYLNLSAQEIIRRLSGRRVCKSCKKEYHIEFLPPRREGICDLCGGQLIQREDDREETILKRLKVFEEQTTPLIEYARRKRILKEVSGEGKLEEVTGRILEALGWS
jgi:adenylate kinase